MGTSSRNGYDVVNLVNRSKDTFLKALFTEGMHFNIAVTDAFPCSAVLLVDVRVAAVLLVLSRHQFSVLLAVPSVRETLAAGECTRLFGFYWHRCHLLLGIRKALTGLLP